MRCVACDCLLSDRESTRQHLVSGEYLDLCDDCLSSVEEVIEIPYTDRTDLSLIISEEEPEVETTTIL